MNVVPQSSPQINSSNPLSAICEAKSQSKALCAGQSPDGIATLVQPFDILLSSLISDEVKPSTVAKSKTNNLNWANDSINPLQHAELLGGVLAQPGYFDNIGPADSDAAISLAPTDSRNSKLNPRLGFSRSGPESSANGKTLVETGEIVPRQFKSPETKSTDSKAVSSLSFMPVLGTVQILANSESPLQNQQAETDDNSTMEHKLSDISRQLLTLLTNSQSSSDKNSSTQNGIMAMLAKNVAENPAAKADLLQVLYDLPTDSINKSFSNEVGKILSEISNTSSSGLNDGALNSLSQKFVDNTAGTIAAIHETGQTAKVSSGRQDIIASTLPATDGNSFVGAIRVSSSIQDIGKIQEEATLQSQPAKVSTGELNPNSPSVFMLGSRPDTINDQKDNKVSTVISKQIDIESTPVNKVITDHGSQDANRGDNLAQGSEKIAMKISSDTGKQSSTSNGTYRDKPESNPALRESSQTGFVKQIAAEVYGRGPYTDSQFKEAFQEITHSSNDAIVSPEVNHSQMPDVSQVSQTIVRDAKLMVEQDRTVMNVKLEPESLGSVVLKVSSVDGKLSAEFNVKTPDAHAYLEASIPQMKETLQTNGISLSHLSVSLSSGDPQSKQQQYQLKKHLSADFADMMDTVPESDESASVHGTSQRSFGYNTMEIKI